MGSGQRAVSSRVLRPRLTAHGDSAVPTTWHVLTAQLATGKAIADLPCGETDHATGCLCCRGDSGRGRPCAPAPTAEGGTEFRSIYELRELQEHYLRRLGAHQPWIVSALGDEYRRSRVCLLSSAVVNAPILLRFAGTRQHAVHRLAKSGLCRSPGWAPRSGAPAPADNFNVLLAAWGISPTPA